LCLGRSSCARCRARRCHRMKPFVGPLAELLTAFIKLKQSLGFKYEHEADELYRFSKFSTAFPITEPILSKELVQAWCTKRPTEGVRTCRRRAYSIRQFG